MYASAHTYVRKYIILHQRNLEIPSSVPDYLEGWEDAFEIPKNYGSDQIMAQLYMGVHY